MPDEAAAHADSIVVYGAEGAWPTLVADFRAGRMRPRYEGLRARVFDEQHYAMPRFDLIAGRPYNRMTVQTSRGCPLDCEFCAASIRITSSYQQKPVEHVVAEIRRALDVRRQPFFEFADDNTFVNKKWGKSLLRAIEPLGIRWFTETDISIADDDELLDLLAASGCRQVLIGLESPDPAGLTGIDPHNWKQGRSGDYMRAIDRIQSRGISVNGCFILGLDTHTPAIFESVRDFVRRSGLLEVQLTVQTPFPGTPLYRRLHREGRLLQERFWDRCTLFDVTFEPRQMSVGELESGLRWLFGEVYNEREFPGAQAPVHGDRQGAHPRHVTRHRHKKAALTNLFVNATFRRAMQDLHVIHDPASASVALDPVRSRLLSQLREPMSAAMLAGRMGLPRQKVNYHLRTLEDHGLVRVDSTRRWGGLTERRLVATASSYVVSPGALGPIAATPARSTDRLSAAISWRLRPGRSRSRTMAAQVGRDRKTAGDVVDRHRSEIPSAEDRAAFSRELTAAVGALVSRFHDASAPGGRRHRLVIGAYPAPAKVTGKETT
jgi:DNA-binding transcriptional ArsR family regulator